MSKKTTPAPTPGKVGGAEATSGERRHDTPSPAYLRAHAELYRTDRPRRLPPYGAALARDLMAGRVPWNDARIYVGADAWDRAKRHTASAPRLLLPPGDSPDHYRWPVEGCQVWVIAAGTVADSTLLRLAELLLDAGAEVVRISPPGGGMSVLGRGRP